MTWILAALLVTTLAAGPATADLGGYCDGNLDAGCKGECDHPHPTNRDQTPYNCATCDAYVGGACMRDLDHIR